VNSKVLEVMESLWTLWSPERSRSKNSQSTPRPSSRPPPVHSSSSSSSDSNSDAPPTPAQTFIPIELLPNFPTAWQAAASASCISDVRAAASAAVPAAPSTPYLRCSREGMGLGQLVLTAGPLTQQEAKAKKRVWTVAKQVRSAPAQ